MPYYEVNHTVLLTETQKYDLASRITTIHSELFSTPKLFVNVRFTDLSPSDGTGTNLFVGGKARAKNHILAHVRTAPSRTKANFDDLCAQIQTAWNEVAPLPKVKRSAPDEDRELYSVFVLGDIVAGREAGFAIPEAGKDGEWLAENMVAFRARVENGEEEFRDLIEEVEERGLVAGQKTAAQRLEEALGLGDAA